MVDARPRATDRFRWSPRGHLDRFKHPTSRGNKRPSSKSAIQLRVIDGVCLTHVGPFTKELQPSRLRRSEQHSR